MPVSCCCRLLKVELSVCALLSSALRVAVEVGLELRLLTAEKKPCKGVDRPALESDRAPSACEA